MKCDRCNGFMVVEDCIDIKGGKDDYWIQAMRCVMCGNLMDPMIARHHIMRPVEVLPLKKGKIRRAPRTPVARLIA